MLVKLFLTLLCSILIILTTSDVPAIAQTKNNPFAATRSSKSAYLVRCEASPLPVPLNEPIKLIVKIFDGQTGKEQLSGLQLDVDGDMPEHNHGLIVEPKVTTRADGSYLVEGLLFHMPGEWELYLDITRAGLTERTLIKFEVE